jgi:ribonuclease T2
MANALAKCSLWTIAAALAAWLTACGEPAAPPKPPAPKPPMQTLERAGGFDFYVLSLSWSPTYCVDKGESADPAQCAARRPFAFVVHGLWPQNEKGYPEFCDAAPGARAGPDSDLVKSMLDIAPSPDLVRHEWTKHGTCSGLNAEDYFAVTRRARAAVAIPEDWRRADKLRATSPDALETAFLDANPGMKPDGIAVVCSGRRLGEIRVCLTKSLAFRGCAEVDARACGRPEITAPAWRGH